MAPPLHMDLENQPADVYELTPVNPWTSEADVLRAFEQFDAELARRSATDPDVADRARLEVLTVMAADARTRSIKPREIRAVVVRHMPRMHVDWERAGRAARMWCPTVAGWTLALLALLYFTAIFLQPREVHM